ncbi:MAG: sigma-70 family RNA polymerase sigma factor [Fimbriimonadaceae bacterium]|nr:sigma-70 family RNA polymerase sigma factor [Fimbriimonadaceae bacterium]QYK56878.1 MAG: sigma-70 family RNA polymerase sigma factor [Fimbriimonadaceae bacterium]
MSESIAQSRVDGERLVKDYVADPRPDMKDIIIVHYSTMVERIARRFSGVEPFEDLVQVGYIGLLNALSKFDPSEGVRFNTYATHLVAGEIKHYLRDKTQMIRHPAWVQELRQRLNRASIELQARYGRVPSHREIADHCKVSEQAVQEVLAAQDLLRVASLDTPILEDEEGDSDLDKLESGGGNPVPVEDRVVLEAAMRQLRELEREVLVMFHFDGLSQTEIATDLGISCNYVSHILRQSVSKLRKILTNEERADRALRPESDHAQDVLCPETGVYSSHYFKGRLTEEAHRAAAGEGEVATIIVRFDGLESLRSFYGDDSVRDFLVDAGEYLKACVRGLDVVCRYDKTGFGIVLPLTGANAIVVRQRIEARCQQWVASRLGPIGGISVFVGHAFAPEAGRSYQELLAVALSETGRPEAQKAA